MFFYCCNLFGLSGHDEHHSLECNQFLLGEDNRGKFIEFTGRSTKTFRGGLAHNELHNITVSLGTAAWPTSSRYIYLDALGNKGLFYRRPPAGSHPRYGYN